MSKKKYFLGFCIGIAAIGLLLLSYCLVYAKRIYPNTYVGKESVGGLNRQEAKDKLQKAVESNNIEKVILSFEEQKWEIIPSEVNLDYNVEATAEEAWQLGRRESFWLSFADQLLAPFRKKENDFAFTYDKDKLDAKIKDITGKIDIEPKTITFELKNSQVVLSPSKSGQKVEQEETKKALFSAFNYFQNETGVIVNEVVPKVKEENTGQARAQFENLVSGKLELSSENQTFSLKPEELQEWAVFIEQEKNGDYFLAMNLNEEKIKQYLSGLASKINKEAIDVRLTISGGAATVFQPHQNGYNLDENVTFEAIKKALLDEKGDRKVALSVKTILPNVRTDNLNELGIKELIGEGTTSFKGSPKNRITNITIGGNLFNGTLIKPGEEFSFNKVLGDVSAKKGFLPGLVIKEDKLIPETGGGLCQVSTTMFRATIYSGLEVTARTPHSFRVRYYEPPVGLDATVYQPNPDLKFKNDTPGYILIQTTVSGSSLTFSFYGTKDGRTVKIDGPFTSDSRSPGPAVYIDDSSLPAGTVKQIEKAVPGLTATVKYTVMRDGQALHQQTFVSKYVAWSAKYKRGTGAAAAPAPAPETPSVPETPPDISN